MKSRSVPRWLRFLLPLTLIIVWFAAAGIGGPYFGKIGEQAEVDLAAFLPKNAESAEVNELQKKFSDQDALPAIIVFEAEQGKISEANVEKINEAGEEIAKLDGIEGEISPAVVSDDEQAALIAVPIKSGGDIEGILDSTKEEVRAANLNNVEFYAAGPAALNSELSAAFEGIDGLLLGVALSVVFVILILVYRSPLLPIFVLMTSVFALSAAILIVYFFVVRGWLDFNGQTQGILFILTIGAATDYSLLYVARYREELHRLKAPWEATKKSLRGAFEPILASASTIIAGLLCLLISQLSSNQALGPVGSIGIVMAMLSALTFLPAILLLLGRASFWPFMPKYDAKAKSDEYAGSKLWVKVGNFIKAYPRRIWIVTSLVLLICVAGVTQLKADGVPQSELALGYSEAREGQRVLDDHFPSGSGSPAQIIVDEDKQTEAVQTLEADEGVASVSVVVDSEEFNSKPLGNEAEEIRNEIRANIEERLDEQRQQLNNQAEAIETQAGPAAAEQFRQQAAAQIPEVDELVEEAYPFSDVSAKTVDGNVQLQATLTDAPDSDAAESTIQRLRDDMKRVDSSALVGGTSAIALDTINAAKRDRAVIIPLVLVVITVILMLLLRSILAPILLLLTTILSFGATFGVAALLFNNVWNFPGADPLIVLYGFIFLVALGIDYNIFLMTRVREETLKVGTRKGVIRGLVVTGGVITSAGIVLAATFAALSVIPVLFLVQLAFIVAFGVLLDTFIVRSLIVPALVRDMGSVIWWPSKLRKKE